jgi:polysaccharide transporter, PST family
MTHRKTILENVVSLYLVQFANFILPLITFPYLVRVLGTDKFGLLAFAGAFVQFFVSFTDYGFNYSATRRISVHRDDPLIVSTIFSSVLIVKVLFMILSFIVITILTLSINRFRSEAVLYFITSLAVLGNVIFPVFFYQGIEKMKLLSVFNLISRVVTVSCIFVFIHNSGDFLRAAFIQTAGVLISGIISLLTLRVVYPKLNLVRPKRSYIIGMLSEGWSFFVTILSTTLFMSSNVFILGLFTNNAIVGSFAIADKIVRAVTNLSAPIGNAIYPRVGALFAISREKAMLFLRKVLFTSGAVFILASLCLFIFSELLVKIVTGTNDHNISLLVRILSPLPFSVYLDNFYGVQILFNIGQSKVLMMIILCAGIYSVVASIAVVPFYHAVATAFVYLTTELIILFWAIIQVRKAGLYLVKEKYI